MTSHHPVSGSLHPSSFFRLVVVLWALGGLMGCAASKDAAVQPARQECSNQTVLVPGIAGSPGHPIAVENNPNGVSQLAFLMRTMRADLTNARALILAGQPVPPLEERHRLIRCSWPTRPEQRDASFDAFAQAYLAQVKALDAAPKDAHAAFTNVVHGCLACHATTCPGPVEAIEQLQLPDAPPGQ